MGALTAEAGGAVGRSRHCVDRCRQARPDGARRPRTGHAGGGTVHVDSGGLRQPGGEDQLLAGRESPSERRRDDLEQSGHGTGGGGPGMADQGGASQPGESASDAADAATGAESDDRTSEIGYGAGGTAIRSRFAINQVGIEVGPGYQAVRREME